MTLCVDAHGFDRRRAVGDTQRPPFTTFEAEPPSWSVAPRFFGTKRPPRELQLRSRLLDLDSEQHFQGRERFAVQAPRYL
jgi:hypothetical protein